MDDDRKDLLRSIADSVSDTDAVDWKAIGDEHGEIASELANLKKIAGISDRFRAIREEVRGATESPVSASEKETASFNWGTLEVRDELGRGSYGRIFRAFDPKLERTVALKLKATDPHSDESALAEARRLARIRHPNVLAVHGADIHDGQVGIWTDLLTGHTLEEKLNREGPLGASETAIIGIDLCHALSAVHGAQLIHGDLKAANVMREEEGTIVLLDFGSGRLLTGFDPRTTSGLELSQSGEQRTGTPLVMPPEAFEGVDSGIGGDIYALGVLLYRLASGEYPVSADSIDELVERHRKGDRVSLLDRRPDLPSSFVAVVEQALARAPDRYASVDEIEEALSSYITTSTTVGAGSDLAERCPNNLPIQISTFIGRGRLLVQIKALVDEGRLVTLTGTGGSGKSRLAIRTATDLLEKEYEEIRLVELASVFDPDQIYPMIAKSFAVREDPRNGWLDRLSNHIGTRKVLLILDNCEHLLDDCASIVSDLLNENERLHVLATSRQALGVAGEAIHAIHPLEIPGEIDSMELDDLLAIESVSLFLDRARSYGFELTARREDARTVAHICRRLDGIPLAIELAAARVRVLPVHQILERLNDRFKLLRAAQRSLPRHQTLEAMIDWSHGLLTSHEAILFRRLAVFSGGWSLETAEAVCAGGAFAAEDTLEIMSQLVDRSLIERDTDSERNDARFRMLETIHAYAEARLTDSEERATIAAAHSRFFADLAHRGCTALRTPDEERALQRISTDMQNLRSAVDRCLGTEVDVAFGLAFVASISKLWWALGQWNEARMLSQQMLSRPGAEEKTVERFDALASAGYLASNQGDWDESTAFHTEALDIAQSLGDKPRIAGTYGHLGNLNYAQGRCGDAMRYQEKALELAYELDDKGRIGICLSNIGNILDMQGDYELARLRHQESLAVAREAGDQRSEGYTLTRLGDGELLSGNYENARSYYEQSLVIRREINDRWGISVALVGLAEVHQKTSEPEKARPLFEEGAQILREIGDRFSLGKVLSKMAEAAIDTGDYALARAYCEDAVNVAMGIEELRDVSVLLLLYSAIYLKTGEPERAVRLLGASEKISEDLEASLSPEEKVWRSELRSMGNEQVGDREASSLYEVGRRLSAKEAVDQALAE